MRHITMYDGEPRGEILAKISRSRLLRRYLGRPYLRANTWIWRNLVGGGTPAGILTGYIRASRGLLPWLPGWTASAAAATSAHGAHSSVLHTVGSETS
jgi:hypothetical protein